MLDFPIPPKKFAIRHHSNGIKLHTVEESAGSAVGDNHLPGFNPKGDRANKN